MTTDERKSWLASLKVGDEVVIIPQASYQPKRFVRIERVTPTGKIRAGGMLFSNGYHRHHSSIYTFRLSPMTQDLRDEQEASDLVRRFINATPWGRFSLTTLRAVAAVIDADQKREPTS